MGWNHYPTSITLLPSLLSFTFHPSVGAAAQIRRFSEDVDLGLFFPSIIILLVDVNQLASHADSGIICLQDRVLVWGQLHGLPFRPGGVPDWEVLVQEGSGGHPSFLLLHLLDPDDLTSRDLTKKLVKIVILLSHDLSALIILNIRT